MARARKLPLPHSEEAERAVLGALLLEPIHLARLRTGLRPEDWYVERHRLLYQAFLDVADAGATPDLLTLQAHLDQAGTLAAVGGLAWLATLDLDLPDIGRLDEYAEIVRERSVRRALIAEAKKAILGTVETAKPVTELLAALRDTADQLLRDLEARAWWLKARHPDLGLLVVDYLQLVTAGVKVDQRRLEIAHITRKLKELAGELGLPVLVLSQLNRELTRRSDPRPQLADLAESGAIEQDADQVAFIHRPEIYAPADHALRGLAEIIVAKHRQGQTGTVSLTWSGATTSFRNPSEIR